MTSHVASLVVDSRCRLGEGIVWDDRRAALFWADITAQQLWMHRPGTRQTRTWSVPAALGCIALCADGRLLLGLAKGLYLAQPDAQDGALALDPVADVEPELAHTRINDGRCDRAGNFVFGTKCERPDVAPRGRFYQFSFAHGLRRLALPEASIPNSICFSRDGGTLYFCDSVVPEIRCCDYDAQGAGVENVRRFARLDDPAASPDGSCVDAQGGLWNAQWGAGRVVRHRADGTIDATVSVAAKNPSCCAFGGAGLDRLYVTSARAEMSARELDALPQSGALFAVQGIGVGLPENRVALP